MGALSNRLYPIARQLGREGHKVFVATGMPNYPTGVVHPAYRGRVTLDETMEGCRILRTLCHVTPRNRGRVSQLRSYLSFIPAALRSGLRAGPVDVVLVSSPPLFPAIAAIALARIRAARLVLDVRDLWPDELVTYAGLKHGSPAIRLLSRLERYSYRRADCVLATTQSIAETIVQRGGRRDRVCLLPNGADLSLFKPPAMPEAERDPFTVSYVGLLGIKHGLEVLLDAAERFDPGEGVRFVLVGDGPRRQFLATQAAERGLRHVRIAGSVPIDEVPNVLHEADVCVAAFRPEPYPRKIILVKIFEYMACGRPVVAAVEGESAEVVRKSGGGLVVAPGDANGLARAIRYLRDHPHLRAQMGAAGRASVEQNFSRERWAEHLVRLLCRLCDEPPLRGAPIAEPIR